MLEQTAPEKLIGELETAVDRLRSLYEQYFMGIEKLEPTVPRKDVDRRIHLLRKEQIRNTALRFRFQMLVQRYNTYQTHWQRICREIEGGTYKRHLIRAKRRFGSSQPPPRGQPPSVQPVGPEPGAPVSLDLAAELAELDREFAPAEFDIQVDVDIPESAATPPVVPVPRPVPFQAKPPGPPPLSRKVGPTPGVTGPPPRAGSLAAPLPPARPPLPPPRAPSLPLSPPRPGPPPPTQPKAAVAPAPPRPAPPPAKNTGLPEERLKTLYAQYVEAKRRQNESTAAITYQSVAKTLRESGDKLREKHGKLVDFEVTVKDGKTILKPVLK